MASIEERLKVRDWDPNPGDQLIGEIVELSERETKFGPYPLLVVRDDDATLHSVHCLRGGLLWPVVRERPSVGTRVGIRYDGQTGSSNAHSYVVVFDKAATAPDWDRIATAQQERSDDKPAGNGSVSTAWPVKTPEGDPWADKR